MFIIPARDAILKPFTIAEREDLNGEELHKAVLPVVIMLEDEDVGVIPGRGKACTALLKANRLDDTGEGARTDKLMIKRTHAPLILVLTHKGSDYALGARVKGSMEFRVVGGVPALALRLDVHIPRDDLRYLPGAVLSDTLVAEIRDPQALPGITDDAPLAKAAKALSDFSATALSLGGVEVEATV
jgi:hypothetical protein